MKKGMIKAGIGLAVGGSLLITTTILSMAQGPSGYEALKSALKNTKKIENATLVLSGKATDNQKDILDVNSTLKASHKDRKMSGTVSIKSDNTSKNISIFADKDNHVMNVQGTDTYYKFECDKANIKAHFDEKENPQIEQIHEKILDAVVGDFKNQVKQVNSINGDKVLSVNLEKNNIPEIVDMMLSLHHNKEEAAIRKQTHFKIGEILGTDQADIKVPELVSDVKANKISLEVTVDKNNLIKEIDANINVSGKDEAGKVHNESLDLNTDIKDVNTTKVDTISLQDKNVKTIKPGDLCPQMR
ncbi:MAG TPA: hypothetical protein VF941_14500 [Clostridia bacterium]